ncbi:hypothetical protein B9Z55_006860 [Caenorhabditis nigoni]|nr:hypothetical protein B9Z55_006860 [Caenorhabditis nigoni]
MKSGKETESAVVLENIKSLEKLMLAVAIETEEIKNRHEQKFNALSDRLNSIEASISKLSNAYEDAQKSKEYPKEEPINEFTVSSNNTTNVPSKTMKRFQLKHVFEDVSNFEENKYNYSQWENHYNVKWNMSVTRHNKHLCFFIDCEPVAPADEWSIRTKLECKVVSRNHDVVIRTWESCYGKCKTWGFLHFLEWEEMNKWYLVDGNLTVEAKVTINETTGLEKMKIRKFDESQKDVSDVILVVRNTKFYVSKMYLAAQSSVFKTLLLGNFSESKKSEVPLNGIEPDDFHYFLEVLYGESAIDEANVEDIALLADMYNAPTAIRKCEEFLLEKSKKTFKRKLEIATRYKLENLEEKCLSEARIVSKDS